MAKKPPRPVDVYEKLVNGAKLTDEDIEIGRTHFRATADHLRLCGPVFRLAWREAQRTADAFDGFYIERQRKG